MESKLAHLRTLPAVRDRAEAVFKKAHVNELKHFDVDMTKMDDVAEYVAELVKYDFGADFSSIPPHGRWQHLDAGGIERVRPLLATWTGVDKIEKLRRLIDLFVISVLLDAGAGNFWSFSSDGERYTRSEGIAVASFRMFESGAFASDPDKPHQVDGARLRALTEEDLAAGLQVHANNPLADLTGRVHLLNRLGKALRNKEFFKPGERPGCMLDYLLNAPETQKSSSGSPIISVSALWRVLIYGFSSIWDRSKRIVVGDEVLGDAWHSDSLQASQSDELADIVPFHKLTQWLAYSLMTPFESVLGVQFTETHLLTGLPEYRNGGLFTDLGVLRLKATDAQRGKQAFDEACLTDIPSAEAVPLFLYCDPVTVEWRALTVCLLDRLLEVVNEKLGAKLSLAQMLEAGSWKGGRKIAAQKRPVSKGPPIMVVGDGTLF